MSISFSLPENVEQHLRERLGDLDQVAKEAALVELYRQEALTHHQLATALGLGRFETDGLLKRHGVTEDSMTIEEHRAQVEALERLLGD